MAIDDELILSAIRAISAVQGVYITPDALVEDVVQAAKVWPSRVDFEAAIASTVRAMEQARDGRICASELADAYGGWSSYHYQPHRRQRVKADMRLVFRPIEGGIEVKGFGHRFRPLDLYHRLMNDSAKRK